MPPKLAGRSAGSYRVANRLLSGVGRCFLQNKTTAERVEVTEDTLLGKGKGDAEYPLALVSAIAGSGSI